MKGITIWINFHQRQAQIKNNQKILRNNKNESSNLEKFVSYVEKNVFHWCLCVCVCVCVYILPPWRLLSTARCPRHTWEVLINDLMLWIFIWVLLPSSFISSFISFIIFHLQRRNSNLPKNWRENDMMYCVLRKDDIYGYRI